MTLIRSISHVFDRLATQMVGQDVERHDLVPGRRTGGDSAALAQLHASQGITPLGIGR